MDYALSIFAGFALVLMPILAVRAAPSLEQQPKAVLILCCLILLLASFAAVWLALLFLPGGLAGALFALISRRWFMNNKPDFVVEEEHHDSQP